MKLKVAYQFGDKIFFNRHEAVQQIYREDNSNVVKTVLLAIEEGSSAHLSKHFIIGEMTEVSFDKIKL